MDVINCILIDDEPLARECLRDYIQKTDFLKLLGEGTNPTQINTLMVDNSVDVIFLDIQMPIMTGLEYLKNNPQRPMVILTTAYPSYALEGFELDVLDYLVKPITFSRFHKSAVKAKDYFQLKQNNAPESQKKESAAYFFVKCDKVYEKINVTDLEFIQAQQNYIVFHTSEDKYMTLMPLKRVWDILPATDFIQVHKSFIVAINKIRTIEKTSLKLTQETIPLSRNFRESVYETVTKKSLFKN
ncbi:LytR/AlgR family response regulator transcription factor [Flagellimonas meridianipacifica]|uniref:DNA-binding LytR/AlgR family response regulator n=1 Tax=Flagellimonas meridianipacifica TaxID=1080225 RepID=A0A2T0MC73_9FLAO|nr:LytTR family DNA-binding domain-containing protein [Allomuricauda pacifica]PRX55042.1 DNA-binding LytR/AlgR family response regulator [Allomuricauda pacifica]